MIVCNSICETIAATRALLLRWSANHCRDLPWRKTRDSYPILLAELLLKRTTATAVSKVYEQLLQKYPTLYHLAGASQRELAEELRPLGLYRQRASAIARLAAYLTVEEQGTIPTSLERLLKVPNLGDYSARAILSFAIGVPYAVLDSNVERILYRLHQNRLHDRLSRARLQMVADSLLPVKRHREFNFALLDLGSLICRPSYPKCDQCPVWSLCDFAHNGVSVKIATIEDIRKSRGLSLVGLSHASGLSKTAVINIEKARTKPSPKSVDKLAKALGTSRSVIKARCSGPKSPKKDVI